MGALKKLSPFFVLSLLKPRSYSSLLEPQVSVHTCSNEKLFSNTYRTKRVTVLNVHDLSEELFGTFARIFSHGRLRISLTNLQFALLMYFGIQKQNPSAIDAPLGISHYQV